MVTVRARVDGTLMQVPVTEGQLVTKGTRGVWNEALLPGKYAFNTYAGKVLPVPTVNFILKWNRAEVGSRSHHCNIAPVQRRRRLCAAGARGGVSRKGGPPR
jgi:hypothetical protein